MAIDIKKFINRFVEEARDHINRLGDGLVAMESGRADAEGINAIFRSAHTIKGSSRMLKLLPITDTAHKLEDVMGALREGSISFTPALGQLLYRAVDALAALVDQLAKTNDGAQLPPADEALCAELAQAAAGQSAPAFTPVQAKTTDTQVEPPPQVPVPPIAPTAGLAADSASPSAPAANVPELKAVETVRVRLSKLDELIKLMGEVVSSHARLHQRLLDVRTIEHELGVHAGTPAALHLHQFTQTLKNDVQVQKVLMDELHDKTLLMRMLPLAIVFEPATRLVRELARSVGKQVECSVTGTEIELDRQMIDKLSDPLIHLFRNAIDHGIETPAQRIAAGKPAQGRLTLSARQDGSWVVVELKDDGGGIALAAVRDKAIKKGFVSAEKAAALTDQEVIDFIFLPGFSTNSIITDLSGRGVGMDVVKRTILDDLQGVVNVETQAGVGTTFSLRLPLSLAVMRILLVQVDGLPFGFTAQYVAELLRLPQESLLTVAERQAVIVRNEFVPVVPLSELLRVPANLVKPSQRPRVGGMLLLVLRVRNEKIAVQIDGLLDECDMVIKPLPAHMHKLPMVSGIVTTGTNALVSVLHAPALLELARRVRTQAVRTEAQAHASESHYKVLVVDDSLNTREIEKDVLEAYGYQVTLAEDGADGLRKALEGDFDAVLTDVEMPHMDGFTLTAKLRQEEKYRSRPIIIITSREKEEDKRRGVQVGADAYIVKGDFDQSNLVSTLRALLG
ncbi:MAG: hybrid sensor histidine kinase/response regulator [Burkholderiaceae bacterium]|nr:hybrid sensor histidine kinase/response regulator [Burkholderiaceae bacterium]